MEFGCGVMGSGLVDCKGRFANPDHTFMEGFESFQQQCMSLLTSYGTIIPIHHIEGPLLAGSGQIVGSLTGSVWVGCDGFRVG